MCLNCGCGMPDERHGDDRNITLEDVRAASAATLQSLDESLRNLADAANDLLERRTADGDAR
jgi:hypothetical protein